MSRSRRHRHRFVRTVARFLNALLLASLCGQSCSPLYSQAAPLTRAQDLLKQGKAQDALDLLLDFHRLQPFDANVCQQIGIAYTQLENLKEAEKFYREAVRLNPQFWAARKNLGTVLWFLDRKDESEREFLAITKVFPADLVPHLYLGLAAYERRDFPRAKMEFARAGTLASSNPEVLPAVFESYLAIHDMSFPAKVMGQVTRAEEPDSALILRLGALLLQYGEFDNAVVALEKLDAAALEWQTALKIKPENATALYQLGLLRRKQGKTAEAERLLQAFQRVKAKKPDEEKSLVEILRVVPEKTALAAH